jgi:hypothetical protein
VGAGPVPRNPTRVILPGCCASATTATLSSTAATRNDVQDVQPVFFIAHLVTEAITQAVIAETIIYGRRETGVVEGERANFDAGLN